jgi:phage baseplate assembly protein gpV
MTFEDLLSEDSAEEKEDASRFYGVVVGQVISLLDPLMLSRVQVKLPFIDSVDKSPWARVAVPMAGMLRGMYFIPAMDDEVLVAFEQGDVNVPYVIGCLWNAKAPPPVQSPVPTLWAIRTQLGNQVVLTDTPPAVTLQSSPTPPASLPTPGSPVGPYSTLTVKTGGIEMQSPQITLEAGISKVTMSPAGIELSCGPTSMKLTPAGAEISAPMVTIKGNAKVSVNGALVTIN